jgi:prepilin-type N-terminal cleavage/methylation domain-containing protein
MNAYVLRRHGDLSVTAFSLVELSIVLVIIGLLAGGIMTGQNLVRASKVRSVAVEAGRFETAINAFREQYSAWPGDFQSAGEYWGYPGGSASNCPGTAGTGTETCDGDGDGVLRGGGAGTNSYHEFFMSWQHMANAGLIEGSYTGRSSSPEAWEHIPGVNAPESKLEQAVWGLDTMYDNAGVAARFNIRYGTALNFGSVAAGMRPRGDVMTPKEARQVDLKLDDGLPSQGSVIVYGVSDCTDADDEDDVFDVNYALDNKTKDCGLILRLGE